MSRAAPRTALAAALAWAAHGCFGGGPVADGVVPASPAEPIVVELPSEARYEPRLHVTSVVAAGAHACATTSDRRVYCWGDNTHGQLGRVDVDASPWPSRAGGEVRAEQLAAGPAQTAVMTPDGEMGHWGVWAPRQDDGITAWATHDTPGLDAIVGATFGGSSALAWDRNGRVVSWGAPDTVAMHTGFRVKPVVVHLGFAVERAAVWSREGKGHGCLVARGGVAACWGDNHRGQLGMPVARVGIFHVPLRARVVSTAVGDGFSCALTDAHAALCWGADDAGQLGDGATRDRDAPAPVSLGGEVLALAAGRHHACALARDGSVWCWGANDHGQLGTGEVEIKSPTPVRVPGLPKATGVACGDDFGCARTEAGEVWCWGANHRGQLGDGTAVGRAFARRATL